MENRNYTIGMAGHIDHGKTTLTKVLTNIDTDRLKEEKERNISIELGFAPLKLKDEWNVSIVDVPGHERFIRQMIAGVSGIDLVLIIIAADEGIMPQTEEHMNILSLLQIHRAIFVITKTSRVEEEQADLVVEDVQLFIQNTPFQASPIIKIDSLTNTGIEKLKDLILEKLMDTPFRNERAPFRMPIDQVFTLTGVGTIARGTIYEGFIHVEDLLVVLPKGLKTKARQVQTHSIEVEKAVAGQRTAIQLAGVHKKELKRGDVVVKEPAYFSKTNIIDVSLTILSNMQSPLKQRSPIKLHTGSSEVYGQIVFFDRNRIIGDEREVLCQIRLQEPIVVKREDRFILRRATPMETLGGGWIINPNGEKYKFGDETINHLKNLMESTPLDHFIQLLSKKGWMTEQEFIKEAAFDEGNVKKVLKNLLTKDKILKIKNYYTLFDTYHSFKKETTNMLRDYHENYPMRLGKNKPELLQYFNIPKEIKEELLRVWIETGDFKQQGQFISLYSFSPHLPTNWEREMNLLIANLNNDGLTVQEWDFYLKNFHIPNDIEADFFQFLVSEKIVYPLMEKYVLHQEVVHSSVTLLKSNTSNSFTVKDAKEILGVSRKYLIPFLELIDRLGFTKRDENQRIWIN